SSQASVTAEFDNSPNGMSFLQLNGTYQVTFKAKGVGGSNQIGVSLTRKAPTATTFFNQSRQLTTSWNTYTITFTPNPGETGNASGALALAFGAINRSAVLLDEVSLKRTGGDATNTSAFRDPVV